MDTTYRLTQKGSEVQTDLNNAEQDHVSLAEHEDNSDIHVTSQNKTDWNAKYDKPGTGIPASDFAAAVQTALEKALSAYQKPNDGIPASDLAAAVQSALTAAVSAYQKPSGGIPSSDFTTSVQNALTAALSAYQKPNTGIPAEDLSAAVQSALTAATGMQQSIDDERDARAAADLTLATAIGTKQTAEQVSAAISAALASYTNTTGMNTAIATALASYYTKTQTDSLLADKQTAAQVSAAITSALTAYYTKTAMDALLAQKQDKLTFDLTPTNNSQNPVTSDGIYDAIQAAVSGLLNTQQVQTLITNALASYSTTAEVSAAIATALQSYSTTAEVGTLITTALTAYATKEYVSQQVQEYQGTFRGTFDTLAELEATVGNHHNDYAWVKVTDSDGDNDYDRYKYNGSSWVYEYRLNNTHFSSADLASIHSGMTEAKRQKLDALPTNADLTTALNGKQAVIQNGASIGLGLGVCTTDATTAAKVATLANFLMLPNMPVSIRFTKAINCTGSTLNINNQGAKPLYIGGNALQPGIVKAGCTITVVYDGTNWNIVCIGGLEQSASPSDLYVDMGLPSGLLWAKKNIDITQADGFAASEYQYEGTFFSWGNTQGHNPQDASSFSYDWGTDNDGPYAQTPGAALNGNVPASMDFARANLGAPWRLPTTEEYAELFANITYIDANGDAIAAETANKLTTINGITGIRLKSNVNNNILFFPCSGFGYGSTWLSRGSGGYYWSGSLYSATDGRDLSFHSGGVHPQYTDFRFYGFSGRAVQ